MSNRVYFALVLVAAVILTMGILWRSGIIEPLVSSVLETPVDRNLTELAGKRESEKGAIESKPEVITPKMKTVVSDDAPQAQIKSPIMKSGALKEKDTLRPFVPKEQEKATSKPETDVHAEQSKSELITPPTESIMDVKQTVGPKTTMSSEGIPSFPYSILLSHCRNVRSAEEVISQYAKRGLVPYWVKIEVSSGVWYRVFVGWFEDRIEAENFKREHGLQEGRIMETAYANLIGVYTSSEELQNRMASLSELGYSPYVTKDQDGESRLFIGAFLTKEGAESQYQDLKSGGIENRVMKR